MSGEGCGIPPTDRQTSADREASRVPHAARARVVDRIVAGKHNREIADELAISIKTVEVHRAHVMEKLGVSSIAELVQVALHDR